MKFFRSRLLTNVSGFAASVLVCSACATNSGVCEPAIGSPFGITEEQLEEYEVLMESGEDSDAIRAWIREADRTIRANNAYAGKEPNHGGEE